MKSAVNVLVIFLTVLYLPMAWFMSYLTYSHIHATELMWFLFWVNIPINILITIVVKMMEKLNK